MTSSSQGSGFNQTQIHQLYSSLFNEAQTLILQYQDSVDNVYKKKHEAALYDHLNQSLELVSANLAQENQIIQEQISGPVPEYQIPLDLQQDAEKEAQNLAYDECLAELRELVRSQQISLDQYTKSLQLFSRYYFETSIVPELN